MDRPSTTGSDDAGTREVVVPLDGSDAAERTLPFALELSRRLGAELRLLTASVDLHEDDAAYLRAQADALGLAPSACEVVADRFPAAAIIEYAQHHPEAAVCMATLGQGVDPHSLGGIADEVVHDIGTPIVLVGPSCPAPALTPSQPVVVTLDGSAAAASVLPLVGRWGATLGATVHVVTVATPSGAGASADQLATAVASLEAAGATAVAEHLPGDEVVHTIVDFVTAVEAGLIALAPTGHGGAMNRALGYVATAVVQQAPVPVLVQRVP